MQSSFVIKMKKKLTDILNDKRFRSIAFIAVFLFTFILRAHDYERVPSPNHLDEQLYAWSGLYLIETGTPVSWSTLSYPERSKVFEGVISYKGGEPSASVTLFKPWLDEPPLFSLLVGTFAHSFGADRNEFVPSSYIRMPVVVVAGLTSIVVFAIATLTGSFWVGILAMLVYGTVPIFVLGSRVAMPENIIAFLFSLTLLLLILFKKKNKGIYLWPVPILAGIAGLSKPTGFFILPIAIYFVFNKLYKDKKTSQAVKYIVYFVIAAIPFVAAYYWYGLHFDKEIFWLINAIQGSRPAGFSSLAFILTTPSIGTAIMRDGWLIFGLLFAFSLFFKKMNENENFIAISFVYWLIIVMLSGGENDLLAWYRFPIYPLLAIIIAWGIKYLIENPNFFTTFITAGLLLGNRKLLVNAFRPNLPVTIYRTLFVGIMAIPVLQTVFRKDNLVKITRVIIVGIVIAGFILNIKYIYNAFTLECENITCPMVPTTPLSTLYFPVLWRLFSL